MTSTPRSETHRPPSWGEHEAEAHLRSLELFGMRFGLDRMRRMMTVLGSPQRRYESIHVLGTNGKTSTTRMIAAILERHGLRTAAYTSPHLVSYRERLQVSGQDMSGEEFARAIARAAWAAERVNRTLSGEDHVTQFELLTAGALWQIAERGAQVAVVEAGLGGRYDATSVIDARLTVLTQRRARAHPLARADGARHRRGEAGRRATRWHARARRGPRAGGAGGGRARGARARCADRRGRRRRRLGAGAGWPRGAPSSGATSRSRGWPPRPICAVGIEPDERAVSEAAASTEVPGRLQVVSTIR